ncbi:PAS domain-containing protein [Pontibacter rugosus]
MATGSTSAGHKEIWPELQITPFAERLEQVYTQSATIAVEEFELAFDRHLNGGKENAYFNIKYHPLLNNEGSAEGVLISAVEVTELVHMRKKLNSWQQSCKKTLNTFSKAQHFMKEPSFGSVSAELCAKIYLFYNTNQKRGLSLRHGERARYLEPTKLQKSIQGAPRLFPRIESRLYNCGSQ